MAARIDGLLLICPVIIANHRERNVPPHIVLKKDAELLSSLELSDAESFNSIQVVQSQKIWNRYQNEILSGIKLADDKFLSSFKKNGL